jgi:hypothetical protein
MMRMFLVIVGSAFLEATNNLEVKNNKMALV